MKKTRISDVIIDKISGEWGEEVNGEPGVKILRTTNFTNDGFLNLENVVERKIKPELVEKKKLIPGDVIIEKSGGSPNQPVGRVVYFNETDADYLCNNFTAILRPSKEVHPKYFFYALFYLHLSKGTLRYQNKTTGILNLKLERYLDEETIPLRDLKTQKEIAHLLEQADKARQQRKAANALTDQFLQSSFLSLFGDPVKNEKGWEMKTLEEVILEGPQNGLYVHADKYGTGVPILRIDSFYDGFIENIEQLKRIRIDEKTISLYLLRENDLVINRVNSRKYLGKTAIVPKLKENTVFESNMMRFSVELKWLDPLFLIYQLQQAHIRQQILQRAKDSVNQSSINQEDVKSFKIFIPPLSLQQQFAGIVVQAEQLRQKQRESERELENLFQGLLQRYFG